MYHKNIYLYIYKVCFSAVMCLIAVLLYPGCGTSLKQTESINSTTIHFIGGELVIDGILNETCWADAESWTLSSVSGDDAPGLPTTVRAVFDDAKLYIGIECQDTDAASTVTGRDSPVSSGDHVTVSLDANGDRTTYALIEIAPTGAIRDAFVVSSIDGGKEQVLAEWDCEKIRTSVTVYGGGPAPDTEDRFWTIEIAIPFDDLYTAPAIPPADGDTWLWNVARVDFTGDRQPSILFPAGSERLHEPSAFAWLVFNRQ